MKKYINEKKNNLLKYDPTTYSSPNGPLSLCPWLDVFSIPKISLPKKYWIKVSKATNVSKRNKNFEIFSKKRLSFSIQYNKAIIKKKYLIIPKEATNELILLIEKKELIKRSTKKNKNNKKIFWYLVKKFLSKKEIIIKFIIIKTVVIFKTAFPIINDIGIK